MEEGQRIEETGRWKPKIVIEKVFFSLAVVFGIAISFQQSIIRSFFFHYSPVFCMLLLWPAVACSHTLGMSGDFSVFKKQMKSKRNKVMYRCNGI